MSGLEAKAILLLTLLGTALAFRVLSDNRLSADLVEIEDDASEQAVQQERAELILTYMKMAEEHANLVQFRHEVMRMGLFCDPCKSVVGYLLVIVTSDKTKNGAKSKLSEKCSNLSFYYSTGCFYVVDNYFDSLWNYLSEKASADYVCQKISAC